jgi:hypothetical protein
VASSSQEPEGENRIAVIRLESGGNHGSMRTTGTARESPVACSSKLEASRRDADELRLEPEDRMMR